MRIGLKPRTSSEPSQLPVRRQATPAYSGRCASSSAIGWLGAGWGEQRRRAASPIELAAGKGNQWTISAWIGGPISPASSARAPVTWIRRSRNGRLRRRRRRRPPASGIRRSAVPSLLWFPYFSKGLIRCVEFWSDGRYARAGRVSTHCSRQDSVSNFRPKFGEFRWFFSFSVSCDKWGSL
jgi:hypothetical protein